MSAKHRALRLGLTGGVGCGKSTAAAVLMYEVLRQKTK